MKRNVISPNDLDAARAKLAKLLHDAKEGSFDGEVRKKLSGELNISELCRKHAVPRVLAYKKLRDLLKSLEDEYKRQPLRTEHGGDVDSSPSTSQREHQKMLALCRYYLVESNQIRARLRNAEDEAARLRREVRPKPRLVAPSDR